MTATRLALIWSPVEDQETARAIARILVAEKLIACANIVPAIQSVFAWDGRIEESAEAGLLCKTSAARLEEAHARLAELHTYDIPVITGWLADSTLPATLQWLDDTLPTGAGQ